MKKIISIILLLAVIGSFLYLTFNQDEGSYIETKLTGVDLENHVFENEFTSYGKMNRFDNQPLKEDTVLEFASNGKVVTAYLTMKLVNQGLLELDEPISTYIPRDTLSDYKADEVTIRQLLTHTSGLSNGVVPVDTVVYREPGSGFEYSGAGFAVLQQVIEAAYQEEFDIIAQKEVFEPLNMDRSSFKYESEFDGNMASSHVALSEYMVYILLPTIAVGLLSFLIVLIIRAIAKSKWNIWNIVSYCLMLGIVATIVLFGFMNKKLAIIAGYTYVIPLVFLIIAIASRKRKFISIIITFVIAGLVLTLPLGQLPIGVDRSDSCNAAFTYKSTSADMNKFMQELLLAERDENHFANPMFAEEVKVNDQISWGLGIAIEEIGDTKTYWHWGSNQGYKSLFVIVPEQDSAYVCASNYDNSLDLLHDEIRGASGLNGKWEIEY